MNKKELEEIKLAAPNYGSMKLNYEEYLVLPHKDLVKVLSALENAEIIKIGYDNQFKEIIPIGEYLQFSIMSFQHYCEEKTKLLLGVEDE